MKLSKMSGGSIKSCCDTQRRKLLLSSLAMLLNPRACISLKGSAAIFLAAGTGLRSAPAIAEPVTICLAIASAVASLIAANNRSDNGIGAVLSASLEYQKTMAGQLFSIQDSMASLLQKVNELPNEMRALFYQERLQRLHADLGVQIIRYTQEASVRAGTFKTYQAWTNDPQTRIVLGSVVDQLDQLAARVIHDRWFDSVSALYVISAVFTSLGARSALGDKQLQLMAEAQRYLDLFQLMSAVDESGSSAASLAVHHANLEQIERELVKQGFVMPVADSTSTQKILLGKLAIQDYTPPILLRKVEHCTRISHNIDIPPKCRTERIYSKARFGELDTFGFYIQVRPYFVSGGKQRGSIDSVEIKQFASESSLITDVISPNASPDISIGPISVTSTVVTQVEAKTREARLANANSSDVFKQADIKRNLISDLLSKYNEEAALAALDAGTLIVLNAARRNVFIFFGKNEGA